MKIGKKSYLIIALVLLVSIFSTLLLKNSTPMKASEEKYSIETDIVNAAGQIPIKITITEPIDEELALSLEGFKNLDAVDLNNGILEEDKKNIVIEDTEDAKVKKITTKVSEKPVQITFFAEKEGQNSFGKITLLNVAQEVLSSTKIEFADKESTLVDKIVAKSLDLTPTADITEQTIGPVPVTAEEKAAANAAANTRFGFDPLQKEATVGTWADFKLAYQDNTVTKITMTQNISNRAISGTAANLGERSKSIEIDGGGFLLDLNDQTLRLAGTPTDGIGFVHVHNMSIKQNVTNAGYNGGTYSWAFIMGNNGTTSARNWYFRVGDIRSFEEVNGEKVARLIRGTRSEITVYGKMTLYTTSENFYAGSVIVEDGTEWYGVNTTSPWSLVWYEQNSSGTDTGAAQKYIVGKHAYVYLQNRGNNPTYPSVYSYYKELEVGENSVYNANMAGNSVRFDNPGVMTIKANAVVNLLSRGDGEVLQYSSNNASVVVEPTGSLYVVGNTTGGVVGLNGGTNRSLTLNSPKGYDIRNRNDRGTAIATTAVATQTFSLSDTDIDLWNVGKKMDGPSQETYALVTNFSSTGTNVVTTSEPGLQNFRYTNYRRIAGTNSKPTMKWEPVTDADKTYKTKVIIGVTPSDNFDENGNVIFDSVEASKDQASVTYTDTFNETHTAMTLDGGFAPFTDTKFNIAGKQISAHAIRGPWISEPDEVTTVIDITPPEPAVVTGGKVTNGMKQLSGKDAEPKSKIYVDINGVRQSVVGRVNDDGTWMYNLPHYLEKGDIVQIFLEDNAAKITQTLTPAVPSTNTDTGNINPASDMVYRDATFKAATKYTVEDVIPDKPLMDKKVVSTGGTTTQVGDTLTYTLTATNGKEAGSGAVWNNVSITDIIPAGLAFDPLTADVTINGTAAVKDTDYTYDVDSRLLTVKAGNLKAGESAIVTFKTEVEQSAVGKTVNNVGTATGFSPRESGTFVEGADDPERAHDIFTKDANVDNPGGSIFGILELVSAPKTINFGETEFSTSGTKINNPSYEGDDLVVKDGRAVQETWTLNARLEKELAKVDDPSVYIPRAIRYVHQNKEITLMGASQAIASRKNENNDPYNISGTWSPEGDGFKLKVESGQSVEAGEYEATIVWELVAGPPPVNP